MTDCTKIKAFVACHENKISASFSIGLIVYVTTIQLGTELYNSNSLNLVGFSLNTDYCSFKNISFFLIRVITECYESERDASTKGLMNMFKNYVKFNIWVISSALYSKYNN